MHQFLPVPFGFFVLVNVLSSSQEPRLALDLFLRPAPDTQGWASLSQSPSGSAGLGSHLVASLCLSRYFLTSLPWSLRSQGGCRLTLFKVHVWSCHFPLGSFQGLPVVQRMQFSLSSTSWLGPRKPCLPLSASSLITAVYSPFPGSTPKVGLVVRALSGVYCMPRTLTLCRLCIWGGWISDLEGTFEGHGVHSPH